MALTPKRQRFVDEYLIDLNATQAAIRAGYSPNTAHEQGAQLLANLSIKNTVEKAIAERSKRTGISQDRVLNELAKIAFADMSNFAEWNDKGVAFVDSDLLSPDDTACISEISETETETDFGTKRTKKIKLHDKLNALEKLGKHLGMFKDKLELSGETGVRIVNDIPRNNSKPN